MKPEEIEVGKRYAAQSGEDIRRVDFIRMKTRGNGLYVGFKHVGAYQPSRPYRVVKLDEFADWSDHVVEEAKEW